MFLSPSFVLNDINSISIANTDSEEIVIIYCTNQSGRFEVSITDNISLSGLHFIECGGNLVTQVNLFQLEYTTFQGLEGTGTALILIATHLWYILKLVLSSIIHMVVSHKNINRPTFYSKFQWPSTFGGAIIAINNDVEINNVTLILKEMLHKSLQLYLLGK